MCVVLLLLVGAASCARPLLPPDRLHHPEHRPSPRYELRPPQPFPLSRDEPHLETPVETSRPGSGTLSQSREVGEHAPPLRTNIRSRHEIEGDRGVKIDKNDRDATHAALQELPKRRSPEAARRSEPNEAPLDNKFNPSADDDEQESTWVWGSNDPPAESTNTTAVDDLDDRTSIDGANCPTGQVKIDGKCVDKH